VYFFLSLFYDFAVFVTHVVKTEKTTDLAKESNFSRPSLNEIIFLLLFSFKAKTLAKIGAIDICVFFTSQPFREKKLFSSQLF
jgi:hypothetical protein